ncbi:ferric reductase like transmembrane component-domain-containing protein, partial [Mycena pura]
MSVDHGTPPTIPADLLPYQSYTEDPKWQSRFTLMWGAALGAAVLVAALQGALRLRSVRDAARALLGVRMRGTYEAVPCCVDECEPPSREKESRASRPSSGTATVGRVLASMRLWSAPGFPLNIGQLVVIAGYAAFALVCIILQVPLQENPNRAGFLALAQLPPVFLFASKNSPLTMLLLGPGIDYTKLNFIHRWAGRFLFLGALVHGTLWINNHVIYDLPILSQQKEGSGVAALSVLCVLVLTSAAPLRRWCYSAFLVCHFLTFPAFFITICYHTIYAMPWIVPPVAFYGADLLLRILRWRVVVGRVEAKGTAGMSLIHVPLAARGWRAGQHVQVRAIIGARAWESHPLSICCAPPGESCLTGPDGAPLGMLLGARACGDWSRALHAFGLQDDADVLDEEETSAAGEKSASNAIAATPEAHDRKTQETRAPEPAAEELRGRDAHFVLEGPYGGPTLNADEYESVLLFAGGSGATFTLGVLDALVARCVPLAPAPSASSPAPKTTRVVWCWCVRSFSAINWFAPYLLQIATRAARPDSALDLRMRIFVTCLCNPDAVPRIPGCTVTEMRPAVWRVLAGMLDPAASASVDALPLSVPAADAEKGIRAGHGDAGARRAPTGGVAVFAAGPSSLIREAGNAVAAANLSAPGRRAGGVAFCAEAFTV